ncbi:hypothetical protein [Microcoleus sp. S13_B4]|uniref:hypothetical protein n=1 Tax=Microcoleus sp. S13_B4 TaxID=3055408 RepID=UPI002FD5772E
MKHIVVLEVIDEKNLTAEVLQEPPMILTWWECISCSIEKQLKIRLLKVKS